MKQTFVVVGSQWGDEGKGKITNYLSSLCDVVVRYQGGDNAGHTIKFNNKTFALHIIPSGVFNKSIMNVLGNGVVINPKTFFQEIDNLINNGYDCKNLFVSDRAHIIFDYHLLLDGINELNLGEAKIGTTKKGIGPSYVDKYNRTGIRVCDFISEDFKDIYLKNVTEKNKILKRNGLEEINFEKSYNEYLILANRLKPYVIDSVSFLNDCYNDGKKILFEGAQGNLLDIDFGTYPFVTSSNASSAGVCSGSGLGPTKIHHVVGVVKAYSTRVGSGAFPTEIENDLADYIRKTGHEYGVTTKRPRRIGWFDAVILKYSANVSGLTSLAVMLLDVLSFIPEISICTGYKLNGKVINTIPARVEDFSKCVPIYTTLPGWDVDITNITNFEDLPVNAKKYLEFIENYVGVPIDIISVGPDKEQTIIKRKII